MTFAPISAAVLDGPGLSHAFFTRQGGVSSGLYGSLNGGLGSNDDRIAVVENRRRMADHLGVAPDRLLTPYQIHSADCVVVDVPFDDAGRPRCDALVTGTRGLALGVTGADCGVLLFSDRKAGIVGAAHAGWKGAVAGILEATLDAMERLGARRETITAVLGPTIRQASYEVGPEFRERLLRDGSTNAGLFRPSVRQDRHLFDLPGYIGSRLQRAGIGRFEDLGLDTYADEGRFYSFRRATHRNEPDYGRLVAAVALG